MVRSRAAVPCCGPMVRSTWESIALSSLRFAVSSRLLDFASGSGSPAAGFEFARGSESLAAGSSGASSSICISARKGDASSCWAMHSADMATRRSMRSAFGSCIIAATAALVAALMLSAACRWEECRVAFFGHTIHCRYGGVRPEAVLAALRVIGRRWCVRFISPPTWRLRKIHQKSRNAKIHAVAAAAGWLEWYDRPCLRPFHLPSQAAQYCEYTVPCLQ